MFSLLDEMKRMQIPVTSKMPEKKMPMMIAAIINSGSVTPDSGDDCRNVMLWKL
jgi:hypothetical protein